jgi:DNA-binding NarL/FixJ family response regulator
MVLIACLIDELVHHWEKGLHNAPAVRRVNDLATLEAAMATFKPALLILDMDLPGFAGAAGFAALQKLSPATRILVSTRAFDAEEELSLLRAGVMGCFRKDIDPDLLNRVVTVVREGGLWVTRSLIPGLIEEIRTRHRDRVQAEPAKKANGLHQLTPREQEVATLVGSGANNKQIARTLDISDRTVKAHLTTIFQKLSIADRLHLALYVNGRES